MFLRILSTLLRPHALPLLLVLSLLVPSLASATDHRPDLAVFARTIGGEAPPEWLVGMIRDGLVESGRFNVIPATSTGIPDDSALVDPSALVPIAADIGVDIYVAIGVRPVVERDLTRLVNDSLATYTETSVTVAAWFYSGGGTLMGTIEESASTTLPAGTDPSLDRLVESAARSVTREALAGVFPVEIHFVAGTGPVFDLPAGTEVGLRKGMALSVVASSTGFPETLQEYEMLRTHGILQVTDAWNGGAQGRLLAGTIVRGGEVIAIEQSKPVLISLAWEGIPISITPGADLTDPDDLETERMMQRIRLDVGTCKWGLNFGGSALFGVADHLSSLGLTFQGSHRMPLSTPGIALRASAGIDVSFLMQEVREPYLSSNGSAVSVGGIADATLEFLPTDHLGIRVSLGGYIGTSVDSWNVTDQYGNPRDAEDDEVYFTGLERSPITFGAGLFYLIY
jgi:hypothetical protein